MNLLARRALGRALRACVREPGAAHESEDLRRVIDQGNLDALAELASSHGVLNFLYLSLMPIEGLDSKRMKHLQHHYGLHLSDHMRALADLRAFQDAIAPREIPWIIFKGPVLSELIYGRPDLRTYRDIDVIVPRQAYADTIQALESSGLKILDQNWTYLIRKRAGQLHVVLPLGTMADVHWHLVNTGRVRDSFSISMEDIFRRARVVPLADFSVRTLDPVDTLVHLGLHAALSGGRRLLWLKDVQTAIAAENPDWQAVMQRACEWRARAAVGIILQRTKRTLEAPIPERVIASLTHSWVRRQGNAIADFIWPPESSHAGTTPSVLWSRTARDAWWGTARAFFQRLAGRISRVPERLGKLGGVKPKTRSTDVLTASGGPEGRATYLDEVTKGFIS